MDELDTLAKRLAFIRRKRGYESQEALAAACGVSQGTIGNYEGIRGGPGVNHRRKAELQTLATALGVTLAWLRDGAGRWDDVQRFDGQQAPATRTAAGEGANVRVVASHDAVELASAHHVLPLTGPICIRADGDLPRHFFAGSDVTIIPIQHRAGDVDVMPPSVADGSVCLASKIGGRVVLGVLTLKDGDFSLSCTDGQTYSAKEHRIELLGKAISATMHLQLSGFNFQPTRLNLT